MAYLLLALRHTDLADKVARAVNQSIIYPKVHIFADGECNVSLEDVAQYHNKNIVIIHSTGNPVHENIMLLALCAQELKYAGAAKVTAIIPYFGYSRQDRTAIPGGKGHAALVARLLQTSGIDEIVTIDLHAEAIINYFSIPVYNLSAQALIADQIKNNHTHLSDVCLIAPDKGITSYVKDIARILHVGTLFFTKERFAPDKMKLMMVEGGHCKGSVGIIIDDIIATGGTAIGVSNDLPERGYAQVYGYFVHAVLSGNALARLQGSVFTKIWVSNTLSLPDNAAYGETIAMYDVSPLIIEYLQGKNDA